RARIEPVAPLGRDASRGRVRMRQQTAPLERRELVPDGRGRDVEVAALDQAFRPDGLPGRDVLLHHEAEDLPLALCQLRLGYGHLQEKRSLRARTSDKQLSSHAAAEEAAATCEGERPALGLPSQAGEAELLEPRERVRVERSLQPG